MIERFNFYDVYGYLIPGFVWVMLLAVPFHLLYNFKALSATEFTAGLVIAYLAGHLLSGMARKFLRSEKFTIPVPGGKTKAVYRSVAVLWDGYPYADKLPPSLKTALGEKFKARFGYDPVAAFDPDEIKQMFFLCRTALAQAKLGSYVEQYQGMNSLTRSLSLAFCTVAVSYSTWTLASIWRLPTRVQSIAVLVLGIGVVAAIIVNMAINEDAARERRAIPTFAATLEQLAWVLTLVAAAIVVCQWQPLSARHCYGLAAGAGVSWLIALRLRSASESFDESLVSAIYRDFVALESGQETKKSNASFKPE